MKEGWQNAAAPSFQLQGISSRRELSGTIVIFTWYRTTMGLFDFFKKEAVPQAQYNLTQASVGLTQELMTDYNKSRHNGPQPVICYAPFKNIYFGHYGKAVACCYNREYVLGEYPNQSIKEIWFGETADKLREFIRNNDLSHGCFGCQLHLLAGDFASVKSKNYDQYNSGERGYPTVMEFELDNTCNLECVMCTGDYSSLIRANREKRAPLKDPYDDAFVQQLEEFIPFLEEVKFYGGEPFLIEIYLKIIDLIIKIKPTVSIQIQTNGTVLNNRVRALLEKANANINVSIDSLQKERYESIRVNANFDRVMENLQAFHTYTKSKGTNLYLSTCAFRQNWEELPDFVRFANKLDVPIHFHTVFQPIQMSLHGLGAVELKNIASSLENALVGLPALTDNEKQNKGQLQSTINQIRAWQAKKETTSVIVDQWAERFGKVKGIDDFISMADEQRNLLPMAERASYDEQKAITIARLRELMLKYQGELDYALWYSLMELPMVDYVNHGNTNSQFLYTYMKVFNQIPIDQAVFPVVQFND